jgi:uncharacterized membrane protein YbhN (UPF0104 family)
VTVFVDRLVGLVGMILVGALASLFVGPELKIAFARGQVEVRRLIWALLVGLVALAIVFLSRRMRRMLQISQLVARLPFADTLRKIDDAIRIYRQHLPIMALALLFTAVIQGASIVAIWMLSRSLGLDRVLFIQCLIIMPIIWLIAAAIPVPGGLGVMENLFIPFFSAAIAGPGGSAVGQAAALAVMNRMLVCSCSLPGAVVPLFGGHLPKADDMARELSTSDDESKG